MDKVPKKLFAVDLDGVVYDWERTARYMLRAEFARRGEIPPAALFQPSNCWDYIENSIPPTYSSWLWSTGIDDGLFRNGNIVTGAYDGVRKLAKLADIVFVTHRPVKAATDTLHWLAGFTRGIEHRGVVFVPHGESKTTIPWDVLVDDCTANCEDAIARGRRAITFRQPWNQGIWDWSWLL